MDSRARMKIDMSGGQIRLDKELNDLDRFVMDFIQILEKNEVNYVLVSGYLSILFGRSRSSEDIDLIVEKIPKDRFTAMWKDIMASFYCLPTDNPDIAYETYLVAPTSVRFSRRGAPIPNIEFKFPKVDLDRWVLKNSRRVLLNGKTIRISPVELQIAYKLFLNSEKDIEDARYLYRLFAEKLDQNLLKSSLEKLDKVDDFNKYLK